MYVCMYVCMHQLCGRLDDVNSGVAQRGELCGGRALSARHDSARVTHAAACECMYVCMYVGMYVWMYV